MGSRAVTASFVVGASLGFGAYGGVPLQLFGSNLMVLPFIFSFGLAALLSYVLAQRYKDPLGLTWYGRYGNTPAGPLLWAFFWAMCVGLAGFGFVFHFPGFGNHYVAKLAPLRTWITEQRCVDHPEKGEHCTLELCEATRRGNKTFADQYCEMHPSTCSHPFGKTPLDWAMENCLATCGCDRDRDPFNPRWSSSQAIRFECEDNGSCIYRNKITAMHYAPIRYPFWIESHVATGCVIILLVPLQLLKKIRMWKDKAFHRWNGRVILLLVIPNQITGLGAAFVGLGDEQSNHGYTVVARLGLATAIYVFSSMVAIAFYSVKVKNIPRHGEFMMRASAIWFGIPFFRTLGPLFEPIVGYRNQFAVTAWLTWIVPLACTELYIRKSDRFVTPACKEQSEHGGQIVDVKSAADLETSDAKIIGKAGTE